MEETGVPGENHRLTQSHCQLSYMIRMGFESDSSGWSTQMGMFSGSGTRSLVHGGGSSGRDLWQPALLLTMRCCSGDKSSFVTSTVCLYPD